MKKSGNIVTENIQREVGRLDGRLESLQKTVERIDAKLDRQFEAIDDHTKYITEIKQTGRIFHWAIGIFGIGWLVSFFKELFAKGN